jgi:hypothetical protein
MQDEENLKYPIGKFSAPKVITDFHIKDWIASVEFFPQLIKQEVYNLSDSELLYKYRSNGRTIKQVLNHCIDSHTNSVIRFKLALSEDNPTIRTYNETAWAGLSDTLLYSVADSIDFLEQIHKRWVFLLKRLTTDQFKRTFRHPDGNEIISLEENLGIYAWHSQHHLQHIINAKKNQF